MSHNLNFANGKYAFASTKPAWHGLGTIVDKPMTAEEAIQKAGLDFIVEKRMNYTTINGKLVELPNSFSIIRTDTNDILYDKASDGYTIVQNREAFAFFDSIVAFDKAIYETAGALGKGEKIFISAKINENFTVAGVDDEIETYILLVSSHDCSLGITALITPIRVVCNNTLNAAFRNYKNKVSIKHTKNVHRNLELAHNLLGIQAKYVEYTKLMLNRLHSIKLTDKQVVELINKVLDVEKKDSTQVRNEAEAIYYAYHTGVGQEDILGTGYGFINGLSYYYDHIKRYRSEKSKFLSIVDGQSKAKLEKATELVLAL
jgi:phage/plasmid-like protein (TIGR03299 family)